MRSSTPKKARPCFSPRRSFAAGGKSAVAGVGILSEPTGLISVIPQPCTTWMPIAPNASSSSSGQAEPPTIIRRSAGSRAPVFSRCASSPSQTVGTPAVKLTRSSAMKAARLGPSRCRPGITSAAPLIGAAYGRPQALTWNIGTTGSTRSTARSASTSPRLMP